eukprot:CAMPEP_0173400008 /NCGR_PEP_ID=MMETSP1356-20130122/46664_1 /TAXON_ID=77927 ORGANISM="Hemiselmis virescens, Strain PCC157" /NCGR_SAMPLE_ID=MMETSP1356 /ASSEMBLY_ACC=CAM_ASM_000847 /LENGTH=69 /DNA_ID=CAMNT_0014359855 /DNA_START=118 /DNA_END=327 /DNA_ORIENTATION=-
MFQVLASDYWSSVAGVVDGLSPKERWDALGMLKGSARDPIDAESWKDARSCTGGSLASKMACWGGKQKQ